MTSLLITVLTIVLLVLLLWLLMWVIERFIGPIPMPVKGIIGAIALILAIIWVVTGHRISL